jgi:hypothetical protein
VVFARSATVGGQKTRSWESAYANLQSICRYPVHWGGDCESTWEAMSEAIRGALSLKTSGFAFASHDIGGFEVFSNRSIILVELGAIHHRRSTNVGFNLVYSQLIHDYMVLRLIVFHGIMGRRQRRIWQSW